MHSKIILLSINTLLLAIIFSGCLDQETKDNQTDNNKNLVGPSDNITITNNCSGTIEGFLVFEVYEGEFHTKEKNTTKPDYNTTCNISIKKGESESYMIRIPENIENNYSNFYFKINYKENSTEYTRSGPWLNSETYKIYETQEGIDWEFIDFDM